MRFKGFDLNLLIALDALISERSVSRAAALLNRSQPAMSAALARLRITFDDPILAAHGKRMIPTPHALALQPKVRSLLGGMEALVSASGAFDPATSQRHFGIGASDYLATVLFSTLLSDLQHAAPDITLNIVPPFDGQTALLEQGRLDILLTPEEHVAPGHPAELLMEEHYVVLGCAANPAFNRAMTEEAFFAAGHVVVEIGRMNRQSFAETHLRSYADRRRVDVVIESFLLAPELVINTNRLTVMQERLANSFARRMAVRHAPLPFPFPEMREFIQYNRVRAADTGLLWMIDRIKAAAEHSRG